ncbi:T7SS effector LXG polymorphic toxin [Metabacillus halosaccharovorans]|uniref:T7SS effector LXG polymorphic toxin n=1 Tax=Metabacillus halosaccharovorans TaxID=930124 RepID=UPI0011161D59|nr:T7SS effector LXG polymorphic toxin [Metabacillus halosaccharovorans]
MLETKGFYQAQIDVAEALLRLIDMQITFLNGLSGAITDIDLSGDTVVDVNFLETDLSIHASNHIAMIESQREDLQKIIDGIDDIVNLEAFSAADFNTAMDDATKKRENTIKDVDALDQQLLEEYKVSESAEFHIGAHFEQLLEATKQGNTISPFNFDALAYKASEAYQLSDEVQQYANDYLSFKEEQEKTNYLPVRSRLFDYDRRKHLLQ